MNRTPLVDLIHRAELPFVGRYHELQLLQLFWLKHDTTPGLRAALIVGEAGVGKSRLLSQFLPQISDNRLLLVHIKFSPESLTSPLRAIARALESALGAKSIPCNQLRTLHDFAEEIPRLAKQHRLIIVLEDIHVLEQSGQYSLSQLLELLRDAPITLLCLARPLSHSWIELLEPYLRLHLELHGLGFQEIEELWKYLFVEHPDSSITDSIAMTTLGNPLVIRSGLLRALQQGAIQSAIQTAGVTVSISLPKFRASLLASTQSLSEAMVQSLYPQQQQTLQLLACLGEVFSIEAARQIVPDIQETLQVLIQRGIISHTRSAPPPLYPFSVSQDRLLAFTHTVLHRELLNSSIPNIELIINAIAAKVPLYSVIPYSLITAVDYRPNLTNKVLEQAIEFTSEINAPLVESEDWQFSLTLITAIQRMMQWITEPFDPAIAQRYQLILLMQQMEYVTHQRDRTEYIRLLNELLKLTAQDLPEDIAPFRLAALSAEARQVIIDQPHRRYELTKSLYHTAQQFTHQRDHVGYMIGIIAVKEFANLAGLKSIMEWAISEIENIIQSYDLNDPIYKAQYIETLSFVIDHFANRGEFEQRLQLLQNLEESGDMSITLKAEYAYLLAADCQIEKVHVIGHEILIPLQKIRSYRYHLKMVAAQILVWGIEGFTIPEIIEKFHSAIVGTPEFLPLRLNYSSIALAAILGQNIESNTELEAIIPSIQSRSSRDIQFYFTVCQNDVATLKGFLLQEEEITNDHIIYWLLTSIAWTSSMEATVIAALQQKPIIIQELLTFRCLIIGIEKMQSRTSTPKAVSKAVSGCIVQLLQWLYQRRVHLYAEALLQRFGHFLDTTTVSEWQKNLTSIKPPPIMDSSRSSVNLL